MRSITQAPYDHDCYLQDINDFHPDEAVWFDDGEFTFCPWLIGDGAFSSFLWTPAMAPAPAPLFMRQLTRV